MPLLVFYHNLVKGQYHLLAARANVITWSDGDQCLVIDSFNSNTYSTLYVLTILFLRTMCCIYFYVVTSHNEIIMMCKFAESGLR